MTDFSGVSITELAVIVAEHLQQQGVEVVLVGGLAVEIYTHNLYLTKDIDMVNTNYQQPQTLRKAMAELGFNKQGRVYVNTTTDITVEFPPGPLSVGNELVRTTTVASIVHGSIPILRVEDVIKDRLAAYIHWVTGNPLFKPRRYCLHISSRQQLFRAFASTKKRTLNINCWKHSINALIKNN